MSAIAVIGAGAWGLALAATQAANGRPVTVLARRAAVVDAINHTRQAPNRLAGVTLPDGVRATTDPAQALADAALVLVAIPAQTVRATLAPMADHFARSAVLVSCAKGIEAQTGMRMSAVLAQVAPDHGVAVLSGPSFADDVARGLPTAVTIAATQMPQALDLARQLTTPTLRCYASDDMAGVELGGALKNVLAIAAGLTQGAGLGASAQAAVISRGFAEMRRLAAANGARDETLGGLSGLGDLVLTCTSPQSRNFAYGVALATAARQDGQSAIPQKLAEGAHTASVARIIADRHGIDVPLIGAVDAVLSGRASLEAVVAELLARPIKAE